MKNYKFRVIGSLILLLSISLVAFADRKNYTPPPQKGYIYIVVRYRQSLDQRTQITVSWGRYNRGEEIRPPAKLLFPGSGLPEGFVIRLSHKNNDSIPLTVETTGSIQQLYQGDEPREWKRGEYRQISW